MQKELRKAIGDEIQRRHGYRFMEQKIKPVHIANALFRVEHESVGRMPVMAQLFEATLGRNTLEQRLSATRKMVEDRRERWGRLAEERDLKASPLMNKVLPLIRTLLGADGAVFGLSPEFSSFSSPTALTVTTDASDDGVGRFIHRLWSGVREEDRLDILDLLHELTSPSNDHSKLDDLSAILVPLVDSVRRKERGAYDAEDLADAYSDVEIELRKAASCLSGYERKLRPNPIASIQRIVLLAALSVFLHASTRCRERYGAPVRVLLFDATGDRYSSVAGASTRCVAEVISDARRYMAEVLSDLLSGYIADWQERPLDSLNSLLEANMHAPIDPASKFAEKLGEIGDETEPESRAVEIADEIVRTLEGSSGRGLDGYLRLLGVRSGLLYPQQKNPNKRLVPTDRTLEVIVASCIDVDQPPLEYRDFLEVLYARWGVIVGGLPEDAARLSGVGAHVPAKELSENSDRFLSRLEEIGLGRRLADSVAVVGLLEDSYD